MSVTYIRNENGVFEQVGPGGATTDVTLSQIGKPADAAAVGSALTNYVTSASASTQLNTKVDKVSGKGLSTNDFTAAYKTGLDDLMSHSHNVYSSLTELGITTFPTTMKIVSETMPANSMVITDTRRINGVSTGYDTETISDWGTDANGVAIIAKGISTARVGMMILYGTTQTSVARIFYGSYAHDANRVNWVDMDSIINGKVDKIKKYSAVDLNTLTESGLYYVADETTALNCPAGSNGHILVMSDGTRVRQVFFRVGTVDSNNYQWYSRSLGSDLTAGENGWSKWWLLSGTEKVWNGGTVLNSEINVGSRYGCQSWVVVARLQSTGALASVVIPRAFLTSNPEEYGRWQIADEECWITFQFYYKSDNNVYIKVVDQTNSEYTTLKYVYRMS